MPKKNEFDVAGAMDKYSTTTAKQKNSNAYQEDRASVLGCGGKLIKGIMLAFSAMLLLFSFGVIIGAGANINGGYIPLINTWLIPVIVLGGFLLLLSSLGGCATMRESRTCLWIYAVLLLLVGLAVLAVSAYALSKAGDEESLMVDAWTHSDASTISNLQETYHCCGLKAYADASAQFPCPPPGPANASEAAMWNASGWNSTVFNGTVLPCLEPLVTSFRSSASTFPIVGVCIFAVMVVAFIMTWCLIRSLGLGHLAKVSTKK